MNKMIQSITQRISTRSETTRAEYLERMASAKRQGTLRNTLSCGNLAHGFAACEAHEKTQLKESQVANIAIVSAYNDMLSAHQPYKDFPDILKKAIREVGCVAQFAGGVPAMCDGITQGQAGMDLSLMSRDVIAMSTAVALSHNMFDGGLMLGICDKIVPGLLMAALSFGHLPYIFVPAGPMPSGISNLEKARIRQQYAAGKTSKQALLDVESASYHAPGTCTFYGTANSNQLLMEMMGLHLPGASFIPPNTKLRTALTDYAAKRVTELTHLTEQYLPICQLFDVKNLVNALVGLLATGGSTNHTMHLIVIARLAGFILNWDDFSDLSKVVPSVTKIYPNGLADINHFQRAGGMAFLIHTLLEADLLHEDVDTVVGHGLMRYTQMPVLEDDKLSWVDGPKQSGDLDVLASAKHPFREQGGLLVLSGGIGRAIIKTSALKNEKAVIKAPAIVFKTQEELEVAFRAGRLNQDFVAVLPFQGPKACGMPELHKLVSTLGVLQDSGYQVALVTDGRMSGASGKVPAAIHVTPEASDGGLIGKIQTGDRIELNLSRGTLEVLASTETLRERKRVHNDLFSWGMGRELFGGMRANLGPAEKGACSLLGYFE